MEFPGRRFKLLTANKSASEGKMNIQKVRKIAKKKGVLTNKLDKTAIIRSIQKAEGNDDCFSTPRVHECNQTGCLWREDCLKQHF